MTDPDDLTWGPSPDPGSEDGTNRKERSTHATVADRNDGDDPDNTNGNGGVADAENAGDADEIDTKAGQDGAGSEEVEPVELLVQLAEDGEIEPWDIDIVAVTDAYLARLDATDLRTSGRALFYSSVLLRMKSDGLVKPDEPDEFDSALESERWENWDAPAEGADQDPIAALEREIDRRLERKRARGTPETLDELVRELRDAERRRLRKASRTYDTSDLPRGVRRGTQTLDYRADDGRIDDEPTAADVTGTAHAEDIEEVIAAVRSSLQEHYDAGREEVLYAEIDTTAGSRVRTFLGLLFLAHRGQIRLRQDDLFGDLWVRNPATTAGAEEAIAD